MSAAYSRTPLKDRARGHWRGILSAIGVDSRTLSGKHGPCPFCREGRDRFRFDDRDGRGTWICGQCGAGDGIAFVQRYLGLLDFRDVAAEVERHIGAAPYSAPRPTITDAERRRRLNKVWREADPIAVGDPVALWLEQRVGITAFPDCLRTARRLYCNGATPPWHAGMIAMISDEQGRPASLHRTFLTTDGQKASVESPRRMMPGELPAGAAVRLMPHAGTLGVAEGIETAFAASKLFDVPTWAVLNTAIMRKFTAPSDVRELTIFADNDANFAGQSAANDLAAKVARVGLRIRVRTPAQTDTDWNDIWLQQDR